MIKEAKKEILAQRRTLRRMYYYLWVAFLLFLITFFPLDLQREGYPAPTILEWLIAAIPFGLVLAISEVQHRMFVTHLKYFEALHKKLSE